MKTYTEETLKNYVRIYYLKVIKDESIRDIRNILEESGKIYQSGTIIAICSKIKNIIENIDHPQHELSNNFLKEFNHIDIKKHIDENFTSKPDNIEDIGNSIQSFFDLNKKVNDEKEKVRLSVDKVVMTQYMKLSHILGDFYELIISLSKEELDTAILVGDKQQKLNSIDANLKALTEESNRILEFKKELNYTFPAPHYWYMYASMLLEDFSFKHDELTAAVDVFKNPYDTDKKRYFLERIKNPFFNFKRMNTTNFRYS